MTPDHTVGLFSETPKGLRENGILFIQDDPKCVILKFSVMRCFGVRVGTVIADRAKFDNQQETNKHHP